MHAPLRAQRQAQDLSQEREKSTRILVNREGKEEDRSSFERISIYITITAACSVDRRRTK